MCLEGQLLADMHCSGPFMPQDGRAAAAAFQQACLAARPRCRMLFNEEKVALLLEPTSSSEGQRAIGVQTSARR